MDSELRNDPAAIQKARQLRQKILEHLYACFQTHPLAPIELRQLAETCMASPLEINWNVIYLEKKGWIQLNFSSECQPFVACSVELTGTGIDLVENREVMDRFFG